MNATPHIYRFANLWFEYPGSAFFHMQPLRLHLEKRMIGNTPTSINCPLHFQRVVILYSDCSFPHHHIAMDSIGPTDLNHSFYATKNVDINILHIPVTTSAWDRLPASAQGPINTRCEVLSVTLAA
jgi:hypothetical protein